MHDRKSALNRIIVCVALVSAGASALVAQTGGKSNTPASSGTPPAAAVSAPNPSDLDKAAIRRAAFDYAEGFYEGAPERMERAVHPAIVKRGPVPASASVPSSVFLQRMSAEMLVETTRQAIGLRTPPDRRNITFALLDVQDDVASAKIFTSGFNDYLHLIKEDGRWRIVNVLWRWPRADAAGMNADDKAAITRAVKDYYDGLEAFDADRVQRVVHPEATLRAFGENPGGKPYLIEGTCDSIVQAIRAKAVQPPAPTTITVLDQYGDLASVLVLSGQTVSYWQLWKQGDEWRLVNRLTRPPVPPAPQPRPLVRQTALGAPMPDFSLPAIQGGTYAPGSLKGKNVLIVFPRGKVGDHWCQICHYQYAELAALETRKHLRKTYNLEVLFVLPYGEAEVKHWSEIFPGQMAVIEGWKNPSDFDKLPDARKESVQRMRDFFPVAFDFTEQPAAIPFPILYDSDHAVSQMLGLFTTNWDGSAVEQNLPTIYLLDTSGRVQFRYTSQTTFDRPNAAYLVKVMDKLLENK